MDLNALVAPQDAALSSQAVLRGDERSLIKRPYPAGKSFSTPDKLRLAARAPMLGTMILSLKRTIALAKKPPRFGAKAMTPEDYRALLALAERLGVATLRWLRVPGRIVYQGKGIPYPNALFLGFAMDRRAFAQAPCMDAQLEVMKIYGKSGAAANELAAFLRSRGYDAAPNHSLGGSVDYACAGQEAGAGRIGRHGMLISPENGACHRSSIVYLNAENLGELFPPAADHGWVAAFCARCGACVRACPTKAIREEALPDGQGNYGCVDYERCAAGFASYGCGVCIKVCPFTNIGYAALKARFAPATR